MKNLQKISLLGIVFLILSCESNTYSEISVVAAKPTYKSNIEALVTAECNSCHSIDAGQYPALDSYIALKEACQTGNVLCRIKGTCGDIMPTSGKMLQSKIDLIQLWATNGFEN